MKRIISLLLPILMAGALHAQEAAVTKIKSKVYGFAAWEMLTDSRKSRDSRDGELYFYPLAQSLDINGRDVNSVRSINMFSVSSRLGYRVEGFEALGAKGASWVEADFFGSGTSTIHLLRIRSALIKLDWERGQLLTGFYWHPVIVDEMIPATLSFGAGAPFHALHNTPQLRYSYLVTPNVKVTGAAIVHSYHRSAGAYDAQRNAGKPELFGQITANSGSEFLFGLSASYKWLRPRTEIAMGGNNRLTTDKELGSFLSHAFGLVKLSDFTLKLEGVYGQELSFLNMIGGYGKITGTDGSNGDYDYTNLNTLSLWLDASYKFDKWGLGLFAGRQDLMGADKNYTAINPGTVNAAAIGDNLSHIYRLSPRVTYSVDKLLFGMEYMLTGAVYGLTWDDRRKVTSSANPVHNHRIMLMTRYSF